MTRYWRASSSVSLDAGPFVAALEYATGRKAVVLGKPAREFFLAALGRRKLSAERVLMIGDDIVSDVSAAQAVGLRAALTKTGKFCSRDLRGNTTPHYVLSSVADLPVLLENLPGTAFHLRGGLS